MDLGIRGETALVLGGTRGLGYACAQALAEAGVRVILNGRDASIGAQAAAALPGAVFVSGDLGEAAQRRRLVSDVARPTAGRRS